MAVHMSKFDDQFKDLLNLSHPDQTNPPGWLGNWFSPSKTTSTHVTTKNHLEHGIRAFNNIFRSVQMTQSNEDLGFLKSLVERIKPKVDHWKNVPGTEEEAQKLSEIFDRVLAFNFPHVIRPTRSSPALATDMSRSVAANISPRLAEESKWAQERFRIDWEEAQRKKAEEQAKAKAEEVKEEEIKNKHVSKVKEILAQNNLTDALFWEALSKEEIPARVKAWGEVLTGYQMAQIATRALESGQEIFRPKLIYLLGSLRAAEFTDFFTAFSQKELQLLNDILHAPCSVIEGKTHTRIYYPGMPNRPQGTEVDKDVYTAKVNLWMKEQLVRGIFARQKTICANLSREVEGLRQQINKENVHSSPGRFQKLAHSAEAKVNQAQELYENLEKLLYQGTVTSEALLDGASFLADIRALDTLRNAFTRGQNGGIWYFLDKLTEERVAAQLELERAITALSEGHGRDEKLSKIVLLINQIPRSLEARSHHLEGCSDAILSELIQKAAPAAAIALIQDNERNIDDEFASPVHLVLFNNPMKTSCCQRTVNKDEWPASNCCPCCRKTGKIEIDYRMQAVLEAARTAKLIQ